MGIARGLASMNGLMLHPVSPAALKKAAVGRGTTRGPDKVTKEEIIEWAEKQFGLTRVTSDEADALALLHWYESGP